MPNPDVPVTPAGEAFTRLVLLVFRLNGLLLEAGDRLTEPTGLTSARWQVMGVIDHGPQTVAGTARIMGLTRQSVQRTADLLVEEGLAVYDDNPDDRRANLVRLTGRGRKALREVEWAQQLWASDLGGLVGQKPLQQACAILEQVRQALEQRQREAEADREGGHPR